MRVYELRSWGLDGLVLSQRPAPEPGPGQVLVRLHAASLNYRDLLTVRGLYNPRQPLPLVPLSDGAGVVEAVGEGVTSVAPGDRVATCFCQGWIGGEPTKDRISRTLGGPLDGALQEALVLDENGVVPVPEHLSDVEAATLPCAALTAWSALVSYGGVKAGDVVLVQGTGGVSLFALQIAKRLGARVILTSSSDAKLERARALGADETINYRSERSWGRVAAELSGGGVDLVVEVGGAGTLAESLRAVRVGGRVALIGVLSGVSEPLNVLPILMRNVCVQGVLVGSRERFVDMNRAFAAGEIHPVVDTVFGFDEAVAAFEYLASAQHFGKICIEIP